MNRKEFITHLIRYILLAFLGVVSLLALYGKRIQVQNECISDQICSSCTSRGSCNLPEKSAIITNQES